MEENNELNSAGITAEETGTAMPEAAAEIEDLSQEDISKIADEVFDDGPKESAAETDPAGIEISKENGTAETVEAISEANADAVAEPPVSQPALTPEPVETAPKTEGREAESKAAGEPGVEPFGKARSETGSGAQAETGSKMPQADEAKPAAERDFKAEFLELGKAYPELVGKQIPDEVFREAVTSGKTVLNCYHTHLIHEQQRELEQLRSEVKTLRQNADNARRAPVGSVTNHAPAARAGNAYEAAWEKA